MDWGPAPRAASPDLGLHLSTSLPSCCLTASPLPPAPHYCYFPATVFDEGLKQRKCSLTEELMNKLCIFTMEYTAMQRKQYQGPTRTCSGRPRYQSPHTLSQCFYKAQTQAKQNNTLFRDTFVGNTVFVKQENDKHKIQGNGCLRGEWRMRWGEAQ